MAKTFISPSKYIQGAGEIKNLGIYTKNWGKKALIILSKGGEKRFGDAVKQSMIEAGVEAVFIIFNGECSKKEINRIVEIIKENHSEVILGIGGGKIFDTAKAAAHYADKPVIICPTIAASDAPCSALSVIYTEDDTVEEYLFLKKNPEMVIMDSEIISKSPIRLTVAGMGDALATYFEARAAQQGGCGNFANGTAGILGCAIPKLCFDVLMSEGAKAKQALEAGALTPSVEAIIEANTLLSGLGFESGGVAMAHAVHNGLSSLSECHDYYHGEKVAFGVLTQLILENASQKELNQVIDFCIAVGLPVSLAEIGITDPSWEKLMEISEIACSESDTGNNMPFEVNPKMVANAILAADAAGRAALYKQLQVDRI